MPKRNFAKKITAEYLYHQAHEVYERIHVNTCGRVNTIYMIFILLMGLCHPQRERVVCEKHVTIFLADIFYGST